LYFVANTTGLSSTISIRYSNSVAPATAVCRLPIVVATSNQTRHRIEHGTIRLLIVIVALKFTHLPSVSTTATALQQQ